MDFPGGPVVKNLPANAGEPGSIPDLERFHMLQDNQACEPQLLNLACREPMLDNKRSHLNEKPTLHLDSSPCLLQLEKAHA